MVKYIPALMASLLAHFDSGELVEFIQFISLLVHKLQVMFFCYCVNRVLMHVL
jgi:exportin-T